MNIDTEEVNIVAILTLDIATRMKSANESDALAAARAQGYRTVDALVKDLLQKFRDQPLTQNFTVSSEIIADEHGNVRLNYTGVVGARWEDEAGVLHLAITNGDVVKILPYNP